MYVARKNHCLRCNRVLILPVPANSVAINQPDGPQEGDASVCTYCFNVAIWTDDGSIRQITETEWENIKEIPEIKAFMDRVGRPIRETKFDPLKLKELTDGDIAGL